MNMYYTHTHTHVFRYKNLFIDIYIPNNIGCVIAKQMKAASGNQKVMISSLMKEVSAMF
jgi:hypothetical protein